MQGVAKSPQNRLSENLGDCFSDEREVMEQVETSRGCDGEGGRKEDVTTQGTAHTGITSCSASLNHHYMLIPIPQDIPFHATHHNSIFMSEYIKILCFPFSLGFRIQLSADQSFIF